MGSVIRMPGESWRDYCRRTAGPGVDVDRVYGPATDGPRFAGETETAWKERLANRARYYAPRSRKTEDDSDDDDR